MNTALPLYTRSLLIRHFKAEDSEIIFQLSREDSLQRWLSDQVYKDREEAENVLNFLISCYDNPKTPGSFPFVLAVCLRQGKLIGHIGLSPYQEGVEIGFAIGEKYCKSGFASEAVVAFTEWVKPKFDLKKIYAVAAAENYASCRVLEKAGFKFLYEKIQPLHQQNRLVKTYII